jgi:hypothetical protein
VSHSQSRAHLTWPAPTYSRTRLHGQPSTSAIARNTRGPLTSSDEPLSIRVRGAGLRRCQLSDEQRIWRLDCLTSASVQLSHTSAWRTPRRAPAAGVGEAPRHEIADRMGPSVSALTERVVGSACTFARSPMPDPPTAGFRHFVTSTPAPVASG